MPHNCQTAEISSFQSWTGSKLLGGLGLEGGPAFPELLPTCPALSSQRSSCSPH